ncbi:MAG: uroporphyrinogen-III synthase [Deltaproteobacteria bacterium]|nr:uroporphyrinogen-III synthase [Deltaproteobacteria bacterium]
MSPADATRQGEAEKALQGRKVLVTRGWEEAGRLAELLADQGAIPVVFPTIALKPPASWAALDRALEALGGYDWLIFTSANGVRFFLDRLSATGRDPEVLKGLRLAAIGPATARALEERGLRAAFVPEEFRAEAVVEGLGRVGLAGRRVLLPRAREARDVLPQGLEALGAVVDVVEAYETVRPDGEVGPVRALLEAGEIAVVTFTSSSTVRNLVAMLGAEAAPTLVNRATVACIGPITARTAADHRIRTDIMPERYTITGLVEAIVGYHRPPGRLSD